MNDLLNGITKSKNLSILVLIVICIISILPHLGVFDPSLMEARNFVTAREMAQEGNWLLPTMNGEPRIAKPPLPTWLTAVVMLIIGNTENVFALRLPAVFAGMLLVLSIYFFIYYQTNNKQLAFMSGAVTCTSLLIIQMSRTGSWDIHCHAWMMAGIAAWIKAIKGDERRIKWLIVSAIFMGLSFLSKGPVSFYALLMPYLIASVALKDYSIKKVKVSHLTVFIITLLVVSFCWPAYIYLHKSEIGAEVVKAETTAWANRHLRPFYFYFHFPVYIGIWAIPLIASFFWKYARTKFENNKTYVFLMVWIFSSLLLLSVIPEKKERYLLPMIIPMALMSAQMFYNFIKAKDLNALNRFDKLVMLIHSVAVAVFNLAAFGFIYKYGVIENQISFLIWLSLGSIFVVFNYYLLKWRYIPQKLFMLTIVSQLFIILNVMPFVPNFAYPNKSFKSLRTLESNDKINQMDLYSMGELNLKHIYAVGKKVKLIHSKQVETFPTQWPVAIISVNPLPTYLNDEWKNKLTIEEVEIINASRNYQKDVLHINVVNLKK